MDELVIVRHGETVGDSSVTLHGATDIALSDVGRRQMERVGDALRRRVFDQLLVSPLARSQESGRIVASRLDATPPAPTVVEGFREVDFGSWEGWTVSDVQARDPEGYRRWRSGAANFAYPGGDTNAGFSERIVAATLAEVAPLEGCSLLVLHKGVIKRLIGTLLGLGERQAWTMPVHLGSVHRLVRDRSNGAWRAVEQNRVDHLGEIWIPD